MFSLPVLRHRRGVALLGLDTVGRLERGLGLLVGGHQCNGLCDELLRGHAATRIFGAGASAWVAGISLARAAIFLLYQAV